MTIGGGAVAWWTSGDPSPPDNELQSLALRNSEGATVPERDPSRPLVPGDSAGLRFDLGQPAAVRLFAALRDAEGNLGFVAPVPLEHGDGDPVGDYVRELDPGEGLEVWCSALDDLHDRAVERDAVR